MATFSVLIQTVSGATFTHAISAGHGRSARACVKSRLRQTGHPDTRQARVLGVREIDPTGRRNFCHGAKFVA